MYRFAATVAVLFLASCVYGARPDLKLPFSADESWKVTVGYNGSGYHKNSDYYALDFSLPGSDDLGKAVLAVAGGSVVSAQYSDSYGYVVDVDHGYDYVSRYAHLLLITVKVGDSVVQGNQLGLCGNTGYSTGAHLHFVMYKDGVEEIPEPMSGYTIFTEGQEYISDNSIVGFCPVSLYADGFNQDGSSQAIAEAYNRHGGLTVLGIPDDNGGGFYVHDWYSQNGLAYVTIQDFSNQSTNNHYSIIYNDSLQSAFLLKGGFRLQYLNNANAPYEYGVLWTDEVTNWVDTNGDYGPTGQTYPAAQEFDLVVMFWDGQNVMVEPKTVHIAGGSGGSDPNDPDPPPEDPPPSIPTPTANLVPFEVTVLTPSPTADRDIEIIVSHVNIGEGSCAESRTVLHEISTGQEWYVSVPALPAGMMFQPIIPVQGLERI